MNMHQNARLTPHGRERIVWQVNTASAQGGLLLLVRHTAVVDTWRSLCYGTTDAPLSRDGCKAARARKLAAWRPDLVFSSPLRRARVLAARIAREAHAPLQIDARLSERHFGSWEGQPWNDIHTETGDAMMGMLTAPKSFRPGGGETTNELRERMLLWQRSLPPRVNILAVCHGGPIAALIGAARGLAPHSWAQLIPPPGGSVAMENLKAIEE